MAYNKYIEYMYVLYISQNNINKNITKMKLFTLNKFI